MNTPRVVMSETKKAFRALDKKNDIEAAIGALNNLKGVGPAMGSGKQFRGGFLRKRAAPPLPPKLCKPVSMVVCVFLVVYGVCSSCTVYCVIFLAR